MSTVIKLKRSETPSQIPGSGSLEVGELAMNVTDGKFYTKNSGGTVVEVGGAGSVTLQDVTDNGGVTTNDLTLNGSDLVFEGALENAFETTLTVEEPTTDKTITLPNRTGTAAVIESGRNIVVEGTSYNTTITTTDPTADRTITFPNVTGTVITTGNLTKDGTTSGDPLTGEGDAIAFAIALGG